MIVQVVQLSKWHNNHGTAQFFTLYTKAVKDASVPFRESHNTSELFSQVIAPANSYSSVCDGNIDVCWMTDLTFAEDV